MYLISSWVMFCVIFSFSNAASDLTANPRLPTTEKYYPITTIPRYDRHSEDYDEAIPDFRQSRGMMVADSDDHHDEMKPEKKAVAEDPWTGYYDFIINEGSFKFFAVFQLLTAILLIYSAFAAAYYAKFNVITTDYDYYDDFLGRSSNEPGASSSWSGLPSSTFQRIFDAISSKKYT